AKARASRTRGIEFLQLGEGTGQGGGPPTRSSALGFSWLSGEETRRGPDHTGISGFIAAKSGDPE
ncbi:MAG: hypothetical protein WB622_13580, partial [Acidobacteriaceae bacterium]